MTDAQREHILILYREAKRRVHNGDVPQKDLKSTLDFITEVEAVLYDVQVIHPTIQIDTPNE